MSINEAQTRKQYIDTALKRNGWTKIVPFKEGVSYKDEAVEEFPTDSGPADYVIFSLEDIILTGVSWQTYHAFHGSMQIYIDGSGYATNNITFSAPTKTM